VAVATALLLIGAWHRHQAISGLTTIIRESKRTGGSAEVVKAMVRYLQHQENPELRDRAKACLDAARIELEGAHWNAAEEARIAFLSNLKATDVDYESVIKRFEAYLAEYPDGKHRAEARIHIDEVSSLQEERFFHAALAIAESATSSRTQQEDALKDYLGKFPEGRHQAKVHAFLAGLPEKEEERTFNNYLEELRTYTEASRFAEAFDLFDRAMWRFKSEVRLTRLSKAEANLIVQTERADSSACVRVVDLDDPKARSRHRKACELYLLCFPEGPNRANVEVEIDRINRHSTQPRKRGPGREENEMGRLADRIVRLLEQRYAAPDEAILEMPRNFGFRSFGKSIPVTIKWAFKNPNYSRDKASTVAGALDLNWQVRYAAQIERDTSQGPLPVAADRIDRDLEAINKTLEVTVDYAIRGREQSAPQVGFRIGKRAGTLVVHHVSPKSQAHDEGLLVGDKLVAVNETWLGEETTAEEAEAMIAAESPSGIRFRFARNGRRFWLTLPVEHLPKIRFDARRTIHISPKSAFETNEVVGEWTPIEAK